MAVGINGAILSKIFIINAEGNSATAYYRAYAAKHCFTALGFTVELHGLENITHLDIQNVSACLFVRTPLFPSVKTFILRLKSLGVTVIADFDDLIFRPDSLHLIDGIKYLCPEEYQEFTERTFLFQEMACVADYITGTTIPLANELSKLNSNVKVIKNYPLDITKSVSFKLASTKRNYDKFVIGYYSGTLTHQADFRQCSVALSDLLSHSDNVELRLVGKFEIDEFHEFKGLEQSIVKIPLLSYEEMLFDLATCHVNLTPLEVNNLFCECKSELKYFDAALVGVPTIASPTFPYKNAIKHGVNGYLASTPDEWLNCLYLLKRNRDLVEQVGLNARRYALSFFGRAAQLNDYRSLAVMFMHRS